MSDRPLEEHLSELREREARAEEGGGRARMERQRRLGRLTPRERIDALLDPGSFCELGRHVVHRHAEKSELLAANLHPGDGVVAGLGTAGGRAVAVYAHDPTVLRGAVGREAARKICRLLDLAGERGLPVVCFADSDGARIEEGTDAIEGYGEVMRRTIRLKGKVPQITLASGLCVGAAAYNATLTDCVGMVAGQSFMFITGPKVTKVVTGEDVELGDLGGPELHAKKTGACQAVLPTEREGIEWVRRVLSFLEPVRPGEDPPGRETDELARLLPTASRRGYDMRRVAAEVFDRDSLLELSEKFAPNLLTAFGRLSGRAVALVASNPLHLGGCIDVDASLKGAAFVEWASALRLPIVTLVDSPGYLPGRKQEEGGIVPHGARLLTAYGKAAGPLLCLIVRKSFGGASVLSFAADLRLALPTARVGPMGADARAEVVLGPELEGPENQAAREERRRKREQWLERHDTAWEPAEAGYIDRVIPPQAVRKELSIALERLCAGAPRG